MLKIGQEGGRVKGGERSKRTAKRRHSAICRGHSHVPFPLPRKMLVTGGVDGARDRWTQTPRTQTRAALPHSIVIKGKGLDPEKRPPKHRKQREVQSEHPKKEETSDLRKSNAHST